MGDFVGYNGASIFTPHPKLVIEAGYAGVFNDGYAFADGYNYGGEPTVWSSSTQPNGALTSPAPNTLLCSKSQGSNPIELSNTGLLTITLKQPFARLLFACVQPVCPENDACIIATRVKTTVGQGSATNTALPIITFQLSFNGVVSGLPVDGGIEYLLFLQNASVY